MTDLSTQKPEVNRPSYSFSCCIALILIEDVRQSFYFIFSDIRGIHKRHFEFEGVKDQNCLEVCRFIEV